jgi:hypothetical protein
MNDEEQDMLVVLVVLLLLVETIMGTATGTGVINVGGVVVMYYSSLRVYEHIYKNKQRFLKCGFYF